MKTSKQNQKTSKKKTAAPPFASPPRSALFFLHVFHFFLFSFFLFFLGFEFGGRRAATLPNQNSSAASSRQACPLQQRLPKSLQFWKRLHVFTVEDSLGSGASSRLCFHPRDIWDSNSRASTLLIIRHAAPARFAGVNSVGAVSCIAASGCSGGTSSSVLSAAIGVLVSAAAGIEDHVPCTLGSWPGTHECDPCPCMRSTVRTCCAIHSHATLAQVCSWDAATERQGRDNSGTWLAGWRASTASATQ